MSQVTAFELEPQTHNQNQQNSHLKQQVQISQKRRINIKQPQPLPTPPRALNTQTSIHPKTHTWNLMDIYQSEHLRDFCTPQKIFESFHHARPCSPTQGGTLNKPTAKSFGHGFATSHRFIRHYRAG
jgi:ribosomal protein S10